MQFQSRPHHDDRAARVVHPLAQQVLTEAAALALNHVSQRLQRALIGARHGLATAAVIQERVHGFLQHALFVTHDDVRCLQLQQTTQTVITVDHAAIEIVEIRCRKPAAIQRHQRPQFGRQYRQHLKNHPLGLHARLIKALQDL